MRPAGPGLKTVMSGEREKARVVDGLVTVVAGHYDFHVVVQVGGGQTLQVFEGAHVFPDCGGKVLRFHEPEILAAGVKKDVTESMHPPPAFGLGTNVLRGKN